MKTKTLLWLTGGAVALGLGGWYFFGRGKKVAGYLVKALSAAPSVGTGQALVEAEPQELRDVAALGAFGEVYPGKYPDSAKPYYIWAEGGFGEPVLSKGTFFLLDGTSWVRVKKA